MRAHICPKKFTSPPEGVAEAHGILKPNNSLGKIELFFVRHLIFSFVRLG